MLVPIKNGAPAARAALWGRGRALGQPIPVLQHVRSHAAAAADSHCGAIARGAPEAVPYRRHGAISISTLTAPLHTLNTFSLWMYYTNFFFLLSFNMSSP